MASPAGYPARVRKVDPRHFDAALAAVLLAITLLIDTNPEQPRLIAALWGVALLGSPVLVGRVMRRRVEMQDDLRASARWWCRPGW